MRFVRAFLVLLALIAPSLVHAQTTVLQGGPWAGGHIPQYYGYGTSQPVIMDGGPAGGGTTGVNPGEIGLTARGTGVAPYVGQGTGPFGTNFCDYDAPVDNATGYHFFCLSANAQGGGLIAYGAAGAAVAEPLQINVNGVTYPFPFSIGGILGPATTIANDVACWNNTLGTLLKDCGTFPTGTVGSVATGFGLTGGPITVSGTIGLNFPLIAPVPLTAYGAVAGGSTTVNNQAIVTANSNGIGPYYLPAGVYTTTTNFFSSTGVTQQIEGAGAFVDSSGNTRGRQFSPFTHAIGTMVDYSNPALGFDGDTSQVATEIESAYTSSLVVNGTLVTNGATTSGNVLHFASVPSWVGVGSPLSYRALQVNDFTGLATQITAGTYVTGITPTTVTLSANVASTVALGDNIGFGNNQFMNVPEASMLYMQAYAVQGSLGSIGAGSPSAEANGVFYNGFNDSGSAGSLWGLDINCAVTRAWSGYNAAAPFLTPQCGILAGVSKAAVNGVYIAPVEYQISDQGFHTTANALVLDIARQYSGVANGVPTQYWDAILINGSGSAGFVAMDAGIRFGGLYNYVEDYTNATVTVPAGRSAGPAVTLLPSQGIYFNATGSLNGATAPGNVYMFYETTFSDLHFIVGGIDTLDLNAGIVTIDNKINQLISAGSTATPITTMTNSHATAADDVLLLQGGAASAVNDTTSYFVVLDDTAGVNVGGIKRNGAGAVSYQTTSDMRLKVDLGEETYGIDALRKIHVRDYYRKDDPTQRRENGFFAQELHEVYPWAASVGGDDPYKNPWSVDYGRLTPLIVKSVQDVDARLSALEARMGAMR